MAKANPRGVATLDVGYRKVRLKATLGAIADLEDALGCDFSELESHLGSTRNVAQVIAALARGAGEEVTEEDVEKIRRSSLTIPELMDALQAALSGGASPEPDPKNATAPSR